MGCSSAVENGNKIRCALHTQMHYITCGASRAFFNYKYGFTHISAYKSTLLSSSYFFLLPLLKQIAFIFPQLCVPYAIVCDWQILRMPFTPKMLFEFNLFLRSQSGKSVMMTSPLLSFFEFLVFFFTTK